MNQDLYNLTGESFYNDPGSLQSDWEVTLQWELICIVTPVQELDSIMTVSVKFHGY